jgi:hypothetical protein
VGNSLSIEIRAEGAANDVIRAEGDDGPFFLIKQTIFFFSLGDQEKNESGQTIFRALME